MSAAAAVVIKGAVAGLLAGQIALAGARVRGAPRRVEAVWFVLFLGAVLGLATAGGAGPGGLLATGVLAWVCGAYLAAGDGEAPPPLWHAAAGAVTIGIAASTLAGWWGSRLWLLPAAGAAVLAAYPAYRLLVRRPRAPGARAGYLGALGLLPVAGSLIDQVVQTAGHPPLSLALLGGVPAALAAGWSLAQLDYLRAPPGAPRDLPGPGEERLPVQPRLAIAGYLTAGVAHEFKNILGHIKTTAEWGAAGGDAARALQLIRSHVDAGATGVREMLTTTLRDGPESRSKVAVLGELNKLLGVVAATLQTVRVTIGLQVPAGLAVVTRRRELMLALLNLIQNAGQATAERCADGGTVTVTGREDGGRCILEVTDAAGGVDPAAAGRLFERGYGTGTGSGIGLYLARRLVERNGGDLTYHAVPGGSCFRIELPLDPSPDSRRAASG